MVCKRNCPVGTAINEGGDDAASTDAEALKACRFCVQGSYRSFGIDDFKAGTSECDKCAYGWDPRLGEKAIDYVNASLKRVCKNEKFCPFGTVI